MRVIVIGTKEGNVRIHDTEGFLYDFQHLVDGYIEACAPAELRGQGIELLCNEEGLLRGLDCNVNLFPFFFVGTLVMVGFEGDRFTSLTDKQIDYAMQWLKDLDR